MASKRNNSQNAQVADFDSHGSAGRRYTEQLCGLIERLKGETHLAANYSNDLERRSGATPQGRAIDDLLCWSRLPDLGRRPSLSPQN
jgi:hypothetical protein